jgi:hypothetical protein
MTTKTDRHRHLDLVLRTKRRPPLVELVRTLQGEGKSLRKISADVHAITGEYVSPTTLHDWLNATDEADATEAGQ